MSSANVLTVEAPAVPAGADVRPATRDEWITLANGFGDHNYRHCWDYATLMAERSNASAENVVVTREGRPLALASVRVKRLPGAGIGIAYVSGGPLVRHCGEADPGERLELALDALVREYAGRRRMVLRVAPAPGDAAWNAVQAERFETAGFTVTDEAAAYRTMFVDIGRPLADIRAGLAQKWRNRLNKAERQGVRIAERWDERLFGEFAGLFDELVTRKGFDAPLGPAFYAVLQERLPEAERLLIAIARVEDEPVAGVVAGVHGDTAVYLLGASNAAGRKRNAAYLLQWKVIEAAKARGCRWYDLGGIDAERNPGVFKFKQGFGGDELVGPGPYELTGHRVRSAAVHAAERAFRLVSTVRRRG